MQEARKHAKTPPKYTDELMHALQEMNTLAGDPGAARSAGHDLARVARGCADL
jgi:hypothetical protein